MKKQWPYFLLAFVLPLLLVLGQWGLFTTATVETATLGPYRYAYLEEQGDYSKLAEKQREVGVLLANQGIQRGKGLALILDDPRTTPSSQRKARIGYLIDASANPAAPLLVDEVAARPVLVAQVKAHPALAYGKAYAALLDYTQQHGLALRLPLLERYSSSVLTVEMPLENP